MPIKKKIIGIILILIGLQNSTNGIYYSYNFWELFPPPTMFVLIYPSPFHYYIPLLTLGIVCLLSGVLLLKNNKISVYIANVGLAGEFFLRWEKLTEIQNGYFDSLIWEITAILVLLYGLFILNYQDFKNSRITILKMVILLLGLLLVNFGAGYVYYF